tara:strand:+ start:7155 stop:7328 length:174 start_codon:yes stop_codon:yes gene_type:complete
MGLGSHPTDWVRIHHFTHDKNYVFLNEFISFENKSYNTVIGNNVWIGVNATLFPRVK